MQNNETQAATEPKRAPWNKGKLIGAKPPLRPKHVWSIRTKLQVADRKRDLAMFNLAIGGRNGESESAQARKALPAYSNLKKAIGSVSDGRSCRPRVQSIQSATGSASMRMKLDRCEESAI